LLVVSLCRPHGRTNSSRPASDWARHYNRRARGFAPRPPCARYLAFLDLLLLDPDDYQLRRLHKALTRCAAFQQATTGQVQGSRYGYPNKLCDQPECFYCRIRWKKREARKFTPAKSDVARCMDALHVARVAGRLTAPVPAFTLAPITINLRAYPLDAGPSEIVAAGQECRKILRDAALAVEKLIAPGAIALFGHLECSPPKQAGDVEPYLIAAPRPTGLYTVVHLHAWIVATVAPDVVRREFVQALEDRTAQRRRIRLDERYHETQDLDTSIGEWLHYGAKHLHSITGDDCDDDVEALFWLTRWRKYLRGDGLRGTRIRINLGKIGATLGAFWNEHRAAIFAIFDAFDADLLARMPESARAEYHHWKWMTALTSIIGKKSPPVCYWILPICNNSSRKTLARLLSEAGVPRHASRFYTRRHTGIGFRPRAPPAIPRLSTISCARSR
jgi:hypothetical protein